MKIPCKFCSVLLLVGMIIIHGCDHDVRKSFQKEIEVTADTLSIDNTKDTMIAGSGGTFLFFPKDAFAFADGTTPKGKISIQLKECFSFPEMIRENLTTMSGDQILETRGMIHIAAFADNKELQMKAGKSYVIHFPKDSTENGKVMNLYYGEKTEGEVNWNLDSQSLLKPAATITRTSWTYMCARGEKEDFFDFRDDTGMNLLTYFSKTFDNKKLTLGDKLLKKSYLMSFDKAGTGGLINKKLIEVEDNWSSEPVKNQEIDKYVVDFFNNIPDLKPTFCEEGSFVSNGSINIGFGFIPDYRNKEDYNRSFNQKYSSFNNQNIKTMNEAELNYYIFSASKLGWINCDYFWETKAEKIDYIVKADQASKPNIKLVFTAVKSIMSGEQQGDKYIFKNVPIGQEIKIVAITFDGKKPMLSVAETRTGRQIFDKFQFREFSIGELEKHLGSP